MGPLVYAERRARRQAERLLPGRCVETEVAKEIMAGNVAGGRAGLVFHSDKEWVAKFERRPGRLRPSPRAWVVTDLSPYERRR